MSAQATMAAIFPGLLLLAAFSDLFTYRIPNWLSAAVAVAFLALAPVAGLNATAIANHASCSLAILLIGFFFFARGWIGGGDAKLAAAVALWLGWSNLYAFVILAALAGGVLTLAILIARMPTFSAIFPSVLPKLRSHGEGVPYGVAIAISAIAIYSQSAWMPAFLLLG